MVGPALSLRANESGLFAKVNAHVVETRASDSARLIIEVDFRPPVPHR